MWCDEIPSVRHVNHYAHALIKNYEPLRLQAEFVPSGHCMIGWGHSRTSRVGMRITQDMADVLLNEDLKIMSKMIGGMLEVLLKDNQFSALCAFVHHVGTAALRGSRMLYLLNRGWYDQVPALLMKFTRVHGFEFPETRARRAAEARLWLQADNAMNPMERNAA